MAIVRKILGRSALAAAAATSVYTVPADKQAICTVSICNRTEDPIAIRLALADTSAPTNADYIEYGVEIPGGGVLERTGVVVDEGKHIVAYAVAVGISVVVYGLEQD